MKTDVHTVIVGAGVVGAAVAHALRRQSADVFLVEKESRLGQGISSRNSGVIHAGLYYPHDSLKFRLCREGNSLLYEFARSNGISTMRCGKFLVANSDREIEHLNWLKKNSGILHWTEDIPQGIRAKSALFSPSTGIVDVHGLLDGLIQSSKAQVLFHQDVASIAQCQDGVELRVNGETIIARRVINCAGLQATDFCSGEQHHFAKGSYFQVRHPALAKMDALVYPGIPKDSPFLGIHLTRNIWGEWYLGPDFQWVTSCDYSVSETRRDVFLEAARRYLPWLEAEHLQPAYSGIRPKLSPDGFRDFTFLRQGQEGQIIHCLGVESPGLTACMAIGKYVGRL